MLKFFSKLTTFVIPAIYLKSAILRRCCDILFISSLLSFTSLLLDSPNSDLFLISVDSVWYKVNSGTESNLKIYYLRLGYFPWRKGGFFIWPFKVSIRRRRTSLPETRRTRVHSPQLVGTERGCKVVHSPFGKISKVGGAWFRIIQGTYGSTTKLRIQIKDWFL